LERINSNADNTLKVDIWDIISVAGAIVLIIIIALFINQSTTPEDSQEGITFAPSPSVVTSTYPSQTEIPLTTPTPAESKTHSLITPSQIYYERNYFSYPLFIFPEYSIYFEAGSDPPWKGSGVVEFAYMNEATGGVTQLFSVPYRLWKINCTVIAETNPGYAKIKWMLVNAKNGAVIKGAEYYGSGTIYKTVLVYQTDMYFVVEPTMIDHYTIKLETIEKYL